MVTAPAQARRRPFLISRSVGLPLVAAGLLALAPWQAAGLLRHWPVLAPAIAQTPPPASAPAPAQKHAPVDPLAVLPTSDGTLVEELNRRTAELDRREHDLTTWAAQIAAAERLARAQIAQLSEMRSDVEKLAEQQTTASDEDLSVLVGLYSNMKPGQVAALLGRLEAPQAAAILEKLDIHSAGPALAAMEPTQAVAITEELTRRHAPFRK
jgi:flagellar motility protein MotE (MotC chaperone)